MKYMFVAVVVPVAGAVPELLVEHLRGRDLLVAALAQLLLDLGLDQAQQGRPVGQPERHPGRLLAQHEEAELGAEAAVVARLRLLDPLQVGLEVLLREEGGAVDPGQHLAVLVAAPVGAGDRVELDRLDPPGRGAVRAAAEVLEGAVAVERDGLDAFVRDQVLDQLDLVVLVLGLEDLDRLGDRDVAAGELLVGGDVGAHRLLDRLEVGVGDLDLGRGTRSRSRSRSRSPGRSSPWSPGRAPAPPRPSRGRRRGGSASSASGSRSVRIAISAPSGSGAERSRSSPSTRIASAALARPGPIAAAASAPVAPSGSSSGLPSGSLTVIFVAGLHARPCYPRAAAIDVRVVHAMGPTAALSQRGPGGPGGRRSAGRGSCRATGPRAFPEQVGAGDAAQAQARGTAGGRAVARGDRRSGRPGGGAPPAPRRPRRVDADAAAAQLPGDVALAVFLVEQLRRRRGRGSSRRRPAGAARSAPASRRSGRPGRWRRRAASSRRRRAGRRTPRPGRVRSERRRSDRPAARRRGAAISIAFAAV